jgi:two-component system chemotaxis response regulator CheY
MNILIAEDDPPSAVYLKKVLSTYGQCFVATDGLQAIEEFIRAYEAGIPYNLVCLDIMLPRMDGIQVLNMIQETLGQRQKNRETKIIMISALNDHETVEHVAEGGSDAFLWKPVSIERIEFVLNELGFAKAKAL